MNHIYSLLLSVTALLITTLSAGADTPVIGTWQAYPAFQSQIQKTIVTPNLVYYLSGGFLFSYNPDEQETYQYSNYNMLTDTDIDNAYYNPDGHYLLLFYTSGNIDLLYDDSTVKNLSDINSSELDKPMTLNDVYFDGDKAYLATNFGIVEYDMSRGEVIQSGIYNTPVLAITGIGSHLVMRVSDGIYTIGKNERLASFQSLTKQFDWNDNSFEFVGIDDDSYLAFSRSTINPVVRHRIDFSGAGNHITYDLRASSKNAMSPYLIHGADGSLYYWADGSLFTINSDLREEKVCDLPNNFQDMCIGTWNGASEVWSLSYQGLAAHGFDGEGGITLLVDRYRPCNLSVSNICYFFPSADGRNLFMQNNGITTHKFGFSSGSRGLDVLQNASRISLVDGSIADFTCYPVDAQAPVIVDRQRILGRFGISPVAIAGDPDDADIAFIATADDGIYKVRGTEFIGRFDHTNSPIRYFDNRNILYGMSIDNYGNLWAVTYHADYTTSCLIVLPAAKRKLDPSDIKESDWISVDAPSIDYWGDIDSRILHCKRSNLTAVINSNSSEILLLYDNNGTPANFTDDNFRCFRDEIVDQDGNIINPSAVNSLLEDLEGRIWIGCADGVFEIVNPRSAIKSSENRVIHLKVPRRDGTNAADYLLGTEIVYDMTVDAANRKWIATQTSGLYLVSPDGDEILANFNTDNSPLPTNEIYSVYAHPTGSTIYVGTPYGLYTYTSDATPARNDFDNILAYPNPVRPDYSGDIYITGLMEGTLVKIADSSGAVVRQGLSEGGLFVWDARTASGDRVHSGVYYVMVSSHSGESSDGAVTKIMIIN